MKDRSQSTRRSVWCHVFLKNYFCAIFDFDRTATACSQLWTVPSSAMHIGGYNPLCAHTSLPSYENEDIWDCVIDNEVAQKGLMPVHDNMLGIPPHTLFDLCFRFCAYVRVLISPPSETYGFSPVRSGFQRNSRIVTF